MQASALLKNAISTNLLQQKCIFTVKEEVDSKINAAKKKDNIFVKNVFTR
ncbi:hypothetical protein GRFL_3029 [Christiangramia flava JLT2011]|uniref:Uncharacterized protein n=1 Tax=Christiangramia flava JLT2011 TaxID=1229726 RepID=A0A1L7I974_9FLAO|nr:hypothetical protein GRFL_3029 [Christiangramia flava JLT2011]